MNWSAAERDFGRSVRRIDGRAKVTGAARFPSDEPVPNPAHAFLVTSPIARGRIVAIDLADAKAVPGVLGIFTWQNVGDQVRPVKHLMAGGYANSTLRPLASPEIHFGGQIVALVVATTFAAARAAARQVHIRYAEDRPAATLDSPGAETRPAHELKPGAEDIHVGDAEAAWAAAPVQVDGHYATPTQHHNPMELFTTTCVWEGPKLTIYEPTRFVNGVKFGVAEQLGIDPDNVRVIARYLGGHFGSKLSLSQHTALVAFAARQLNRPVKLVPTRDDCFTLANFRSESRQRVKLGATRDGRLTAFVHEGQNMTSRHDAYLLTGTEVTARMYACPNIATRDVLTRLDRNTPGPMRAPPEVPFLFGLECAIDELAVALAMDPVELRRRNDTARDPVKGIPYSSRPLMACFDAAAKAFGWSSRNPTPGAMQREGWAVGWGCAAAMRPTQISAATVRLRIGSRGRALVQTAHHEIGNGARTIVAMTAAGGLGLPVEQVDVELGDTAFPVAGLSGGSTTTTSLCHVVAKACEAARAKLAVLATQPGGALAGADAKSITLDGGQVRASDGRAAAIATVLTGAAVDPLDIYAENIPEGAPPDAIDKLRHGHLVMSSGRKKAYSAAFGAQFVEVRVHPLTAEIRVARMVGAFAAGRIIDPLTTRSQLEGGMIMGLGSALLEATEIDPRHGLYMNRNLADYLLATCADVPPLEVILVPDEDHEVNPMGLKGLGELGIIGVNAAIANAVYHATGTRVRTLPIRVESLLA